MKRAQESVEGEARHDQSIVYADTERHSKTHEFVQLVCINNLRNKCPSFILLYCAFSFLVTAIMFSCLLRIITLKQNSTLSLTSLFKIPFPKCCQLYHCVSGLVMFIATASF